MDTAVQERNYPRFSFLPKAESVWGAHRLIEVINANTSVSLVANYDNLLTSLFVSSGATAVYSMTISTADVGEEYDHEMVAALLRADAEKPEATFTNVIDMVEWLERD
jgi:hypothetical protein